jgi:hypothetical protein
MEGLPDREIARRLGADKSAVNRHRRFHIEQPNRDRAAIIARDREARAQRQELAAAAEADAPSTAALIEATIGLRRQMEKLVEVEQRLSRVATRAEKDGAHGAVAQVAGAQLRSLEYGSRLAGHPSFVPRAADAGGGASVQPFSITIVLDGRETKITAAPVIEEGVEAVRDDWDYP